MLSKYFYLSKIKFNTVRVHKKLVAKIEIVRDNQIIFFPNCKFVLQFCKKNEVAQAGK